MKKYFLAMPLLALIAIAYFTGCNNASATDEVELKFKLPKGSKYECAMNMEMKMNQKIMDKDVDMKNNMGFTYLFEVVFMILGSIVLASYSRFREYRADAGGARLAGKEAMIGSLQALRSLQEIKDPRENPAMAAFKISHQGQKGLLRLFASHPPLEARIERLQHLKV